jgi:hypothetical protein
MSADQKPAANFTNEHESDQLRVFSCSFGANSDPRLSAQIRGKNYRKRFFKIKIALAGRSAKRHIR